MTERKFEVLRKTHTENDRDIEGQTETKRGPEKLRET